MKQINVDVAIIGAGTAGLTSRRAAKKAGASVVMIDPGPFGTTCARVGCMPSKLLIAAADAAHHARHASTFGIQIENVAIDGAAVLRRVQSERDRFVGFVNRAIDDIKDDGELIVGRARIVSEGRLQVDEHTEVAYNRLVIATGSTPFTPPPFRGIEHALLTNEHIFELEQLPESLLVVGIGVIGLELGQAMSRLGVRTTLLGVGGKIGPIGDPEIRDHAKAILRDELDLHPDYQLHGVEPDANGVRIRFVDSTGRERDERFERVLMAAGRRPNLDKLGLDKIGITPGENRQYDIDPGTLQLGEAPIFVAGDVNSLHPLLHEAADDGRLAGRNAALYPDVRAANRRTPLAIVFSDPQIGIVGTGYAGLADCQAVAGEVDYGDQGRARVQAINRGKVRVYAERSSGRLLGAELFGPRVEHLSHLLAWAIQQGVTVEQALDMPFYHPVVEEGIRTALRDASVNLRHAQPIKCSVSEFGPGVDSRH